MRGRVLRDQLGEKLAQAAGADFDAPIRVRDAAGSDEAAPEGRGKPHAHRRRSA